MPAPMDPRKVSGFDAAIVRDGMSIAGAARRVGVGESWAYARVRRMKGEGRLADVQAQRRAVTDGPIPYGALNSGARRAWDDFGFFRLRYMGRISTGWQVSAAHQVIEALASDRREFTVMNCPPGSGKTVLMADVAAWVTVRDRRVRGMIGSGTQSKAEKLLRMLRSHLERTVPVRANPDLLARGEAVDAEATLAQDFGMFRPLDPASPWHSSGLIVVQPGFEISAEKEHTWEAYGLDADYLGDRVDFMLWDDAVVPKDYRTVEKIEERIERYDTVTESRLEPTGALFLVGQRVNANDLYRHCLNKADLPDDDDTLDALEEMSDTARTETLTQFGKQYRHIIYRAHYDDQCAGQHKRTDPAYPQGCLLSPRRLPWADLRRIRLNNPDQYATWYQQEDGSQTDVLVRKVWVDGGTDPDSGVQHWGCWDPDRDIAQLPANLTGPVFSFATVDPSPTKFWGCQWWCYTPNAGEQLWLMDIPAQRRMRADEFLEWNTSTQCFTGLAEQWQTRSEMLGLPITHWVVEHNGAQRFLLQYEFVRRWVRAHRTAIVPHTTATNKNDPTFGVWMLREPWRTGRVRLPKASTAARLASLKLADEATRYPHGVYDDQVMAMWFLLSRLPALTVIPRTAEQRLDRPSWVSTLDARRLVAVT